MPISDTANQRCVISLFFFLKNLQAEDSRFLFKNRLHRRHFTEKIKALLFSSTDSSDKISLIALHLSQPLTFQVSERTFSHVLCDDINGLLGHHSIERNQFVVPELLHDLSLLEEGLGRHGARLQRLYGHLGGAVPRACRDMERGGRAHRPGVQSVLLIRV